MQKIFILCSLIFSFWSCSNKKTDLNKNYIQPGALNRYTEAHKVSSLIPIERKDRKLSQEEKDKWVQEMTTTMKKWESKYGFEHKDERLTSDDREIYVESWKTDDADAVIVLVNGYADFTEKYHLLVDLVGENNINATKSNKFNVVMYDHFGQGRSSGEDSYIPGDYDKTHVPDLKKVIESQHTLDKNRKKLPVHIVAISMGSWPTFRLASLQEKKEFKIVDRQIKSYSLLSPLFAVNKERIGAYELLLSKVKEKTTEEEVQQDLLKDLLPSNDKSSPAINPLQDLRVLENQFKRRPNASEFTLDHSIRNFMVYGALSKFSFKMTRLGLEKERMENRKSGSAANQEKNTYIDQEEYEKIIDHPLHDLGQPTYGWVQATGKIILEQLLNKDIKQGDKEGDKEKYERAIAQRRMALENNGSKMKLFVPLRDKTVDPFITNLIYHTKLAGFGVELENLDKKNEGHEFLRANLKDRTESFDNILEFINLHQNS